MLDIKCRLVCPIFKQIKNIHYLLGFDGPMDRPCTKPISSCVNGHGVTQIHLLKLIQRVNLDFEGK